MAAVPAGVSEWGGTAGERRWETGIETEGGREGRPAGRWPDSGEERREEAWGAEVSAPAAEEAETVAGGGGAWGRWEELGVEEERQQVRPEWEGGWWAELG